MNNRETFCLFPRIDARATLTLRAMKRPGNSGYSSDFTFVGRTLFGQSAAGLLRLPQ
jgi:hypothetical protein